MTHLFEEESGYEAHTGSRARALAPPANVQTGYSPHGVAQLLPVGARRGLRARARKQSSVSWIALGTLLLCTSKITGVGYHA